MAFRAILRALILAMATLQIACAPSGTDTSVTKVEPAAKEHVVAYYLHGTVRCVTCLDIERIAKETIERGFPEGIASRDLAWESIDYDLPENSDYQDRYDISMPSLVLVRFRGDDEVERRLLDQTWDRIVEGESDLESYVHQEVAAFLAPDRTGA